MKRLLILLALVAAPASADVTQGGKTIDCYCTDSDGGRIELGQSICLFVDGRAFMARCEMSLNNPIWRDTGEGCVSSGLRERLERLEPGVNPSGIRSKV